MATCRCQATPSEGGVVLEKDVEWVEDVTVTSKAHLRLLEQEEAPRIALCFRTKAIAFFCRTGKMLEE